MSGSNQHKQVSANSIFVASNRCDSLRKTINAFTLIELLVAIAIIGILASLLLPGVKMVQTAARSAVCSKNLGQLVMGVHAYVQDWQVMPQADDWGQWRGGPQRASAVYFEMSKGVSDGNMNRDIMKCPADKRPLGSPLGNSSAEGPTYMQCSWASGGSDGEYIRTWTSYTAGAMFRSMSNRYGNMSRVPSTSALYWDGFEIQMEWDRPWLLVSGHNRHRTGINMAFKDGHVKWYDFAPLKSGEYWTAIFWDPNSDSTNAQGIRTVGANIGAQWLRSGAGEPW